MGLSTACNSALGRSHGNEHVLSTGALHKRALCSLFLQWRRECTGQVAPVMMKVDRKKHGEPWHHEAGPRQEMVDISRTCHMVMASKQQWPAGALLMWFQRDTDRGIAKITLFSAILRNISLWSVDSDNFEGCVNNFLGYLPLCCVNMMLIL